MTQHLLDEAALAADVQAFCRKSSRDLAGLIVAVTGATALTADQRGHWHGVMHAHLEIAETLLERADNVLQPVRAPVDPGRQRFGVAALFVDLTGVCAALEGGDAADIGDGLVDLIESLARSDVDAGAIMDPETAAPVENDIAGPARELSERLTPQLVETLSAVAALGDIDRDELWAVCGSRFRVHAVLHALLTSLAHRSHSCGSASLENVLHGATRQHRLLLSNLCIGDRWEVSNCVEETIDALERHECTNLGYRESLLADAVAEVTSMMAGVTQTAAQQLAATADALVAVADADVLRQQQACDQRHAAHQPIQAILDRVHDIVWEDGLSDRFDTVADLRASHNLLLSSLSTKHLRESARYVADAQDDLERHDPTTRKNRETHHAELLATAETRIRQFVDQMTPAFEATLRALAERSETDEDRARRFLSRLQVHRQLHAELVALHRFGEVCFDLSRLDPFEDLTDACSDIESTHESLLKALEDGEAVAATGWAHDIINDPLLNGSSWR